MSRRTARQQEMAGHARWYRARGYNVLPSRRDVKRPALKSYAAWRDGGIPDWVLEKWWGDNAQVCTGVRWRLVVVDLDGPEARAVWRLWCRKHGEPRTWAVERDAASSRHLWFRPPADWHTCATRVLWGVRRGAGWAKGSKVELLGDAGLVIAPPSRHVRTGQPYRWAVGPDDIPEPAEVPGWLAALCRRREPVARPCHPPIRFSPSLPSRRRHHDKAAVMAAIPPEAKLLLARQFGVQLVTETPNAAGWCRCRRDAEDRNPSAGFNVHTGYLAAPHQGVRSSLFELGVRAGAYPDLCTAIDTLGDLFVARPGVTFQQCS